MVGWSTISGWSNSRSHHLFKLARWPFTGGGKPGMAAPSEGTEEICHGFHGGITHHWDIMGIEFRTSVFLHLFFWLLGVKQSIYIYVYIYKLGVSNNKYGDFQGVWKKPGIQWRVPIEKLFLSNFRKGAQSLLLLATTFLNYIQKSSPSIRKTTQSFFKFQQKNVFIAAKLENVFQEKDSLDKMLFESHKSWKMSAVHHHSKRFFCTKDADGPSWVSTIQCRVFLVD